MPEIEIDRKPKIFDDPKWCGAPTETDYKECQFLVLNEECGFFTDDKGEFIELEQKLNDLEDDISIKCDECKQAYKEAKLFQNSVTIGGAIIKKDGTVEHIQDERQIEEDHI
jgi:hypothetical protein